MLAFDGNDRYRVVRQLGEGGMGVVYEVEDRDRGEHVALKMLRYLDVEHFYRMKREFRALADIGHPNLVGFYDLFADRAQCFFTMELLDGEGFIAHCRPAGELDESRLRAALPQLVRGLMALHEAGVVHRDVKPSNVLVSPEGRVVVLDFGLATDTRRADSLAGRIVGTVEYMSPEQAAGEAAAPAADWYAVGVLLYEALTGRVPFAGSTMEVLLHKQEYAAPPPRGVKPDVPEDLDDLCVALLRRDPGARPGGAEVLRRLGVEDHEAGRDASHSTVTRLVRFAGRRREVERLDACFAALARGPRAVVVRGPTGIGKTALIQHYVRELRERESDVLCLSGRCFQRETVPYRAMDDLVDELAGVLLELPPDRAAHLLPEGAALLRRLFPVLGRVPRIAESPLATDIRDPLELRARAFEVLRELFARLAARWRVVLVLDDLQWVDDNSVELLADMMRLPDPPRLMLVMSCRDEAAPAPRAGTRSGRETAKLDALAGSRPAARRGSGMDRLLRMLDVPIERIELAPLDAQDSEQLAGELLGGADSELAQRVAREAGGVPLFIGELSLFLESGGRADDSDPSLEDVLRWRVSRLPERARPLLEIAAVSGEPISARVAATAIDVAPEQVARELRYLRTSRFVRASTTAGDRFEPYHDRIRAVMRGQLTMERRRALHRRLALALEQHAEGDPETLARHWYGAGERQRAAELAQLAAEQAARAVDFDRAARLYDMALDLGRFDPDAERQLVTALGQALANAGRPEEAAAAFNRAAEGADPATRLDLHNRSAGELLRGGYVEQGLDAISRVLAEIGMRLARSPLRALWSVLWRRAWLWVRGLRWTIRHEAEVSKRELTKVDILSSVAISLAIVDTVRGADYQARHVLAALRVGEPTRLSRALGTEAGYLAALGKARRAARAAEIAERLREQHGVQQAPFDLWARGGIHYFRENDWAAALDRFEQVEQELRRAYQSRGWALDTSQAYSCFSRMYQGDFRALARLVPAYVREAERRGDLWASVTLRARLNLVWLMRDDVEGAERDLDDVSASWLPPEDGYQVQHYWLLMSRCELALYRGDPDAAADRIAREMAPLRRSLLLRVPLVRLEVEHLCGRVALARAVRATDARARRKLVATAARHARRMRREVVPLGSALRLLLQAGVANLSGRRPRAVELLQSARDELERNGTQLFGRPAMRRLGQLLDGDEGAELIARADASFRDAGVVDPARMTAVYAPGFD